jgi:hypothetical protein
VEKVKESEVRYPEKMDKDLRNLLEGILVNNPQRRTSRLFEKNTQFEFDFDITDSPFS